MSPRPPHRSNAYWAGVVVMIFVSWAWLASIHYAHKVLIGPFAAPNCRSIGQSDGMFFFCHYHQPRSADLICYESLAGSAKDPISFWRDRHGHPRYEVPPPFNFEKAENGWAARISHWFVLAAFWVTWAGGLRLRSRRWKRHIERDGLLATPVSAATVPATPKS